MTVLPAALEKLVHQFARLPGIGQKSATRMALFVLRDSTDLAENLAKSLMEVKERIKFCSTCFNFTDHDPCQICRDPERANGVLCVVEGPGDQVALEESRAFRGRYHILQGVLSPLDGIGPEQLKIGELLRRIDQEEIREIVLATNPTTEGESTASYLAKVISNKMPAVKISRIAMGVPMGGDLKYMDRMTIEHALRTRIPVSP
jgi:recombination protein RecR